MSLDRLKRLRWSLLCVLSCCLAVSVLGRDTGFAQEPPAASTPLEAPPPPAEDPAEPPAADKEKLTMAYIGLLALVGIVVLGFGTLAIFSLWASRLRRINRDAPSRTVIKDELWFLQPARPGNDLPNRNPSQELPPLPEVDSDHDGEADSAADGDAGGDF
ncbi:hypothetical protein GC163_07930 [bacterium]|nr:hypothetical protein [bacterium]